MKALITIIPGMFVFGAVCGQTLESYIGEAEANNPEVQAFEIKYDISKEKIAEAESLPDTEFSAGLFVSEPETRTGAQKARFSVRQMLPWFGTITARENYAYSMAEVDYLEVAITRRKLRISVAQSYYRLFALSKKQEVIHRNILLLETFERLALTSVQVGNASAVDVLRLQIRQNELQAEIDVLQAQYESERVRFNNLLNRESGSDVALVDSLPLVANPDIDLDNLDLHPELEKYDKMYESIGQSEILNQKEASPNIGIGLDYIPVAERAAMEFDDNGKDILMPMVSLAIPIFNNSYKSRSVQNKLQQNEITARKKERRNQLESLLMEAINASKASRIEYETLRKNIDRASDAEEILTKNYETGTIDFNDVLEIQELQLEFRLKQIEALKNIYTQIAAINYLANQY